MGFFRWFRRRSIRGPRVVKARMRSYADRQANAWGIPDRMPVLERIAPPKPKTSRSSLSERARKRSRSIIIDVDDERRRNRAVNGPSDRRGGDLHKAMSLSQKAVAARGVRGSSPAQRSDRVQPAKKSPRKSQREPMRDDQDCVPRPDPNRAPMGHGGRSARAARAGEDDSKDKRERRRWRPWCKD